MSRYILGRLGQALIVVLLVSVIVFLMFNALPGGPARAIIGPGATPLQVEQFEQEMGLDRPLLLQYVTWFTNILQGDFGYSYQMNRGVSSLLAERLPKTMLLTGLAMLLAVVLGVCAGVAQAARRNKFLDQALTGIAYVGYAIPDFFLAIIFVSIFAVNLRMFPAQAPQGTSVIEILGQGNALVLPVLSYALGLAAVFSRYVRSSMIDNLLDDYVRTARAKGARMVRVYVRHVMRNAMSPVVTLLGLLLPAILSGAIITEAVFNYPGMGQLFWTAAQARDFPVLLGITLVVGMATVVGSLLADIGYAVLNPRVRLTER